MVQKHPQERRKDWRAITQEVSKETDPVRLIELACELELALDRHDRKGETHGAEQGAPPPVRV